MVGVFQPWHLIVVLVIVMMVFGPGKLPELGKAIGDGLRELKKSTSGEAEPTPTPALVALRECTMCGAGLSQNQPFCGACGSPQKLAA
jgi:sec-independent protein translocase protein TatA